MTYNEFIKNQEQIDILIKEIEDKEAQIALLVKEICGLSQCINDMAGKIEFDKMSNLPLNWHQ